MPVPPTPEDPSPAVAPEPPRVPWWSWRRIGLNFLTISILAHILFGIGATYFIVQRIQSKRQLAFQAGPPSPSRSQRTAEHQVQIAKQKQRSGAPVAPKRIAVTGLAKVSLPEPPTVPSAPSALVPGKLSGMGGVGGFGPGTLSAPGTGAAGGAGACRCSACATTAVRRWWARFTTSSRTRTVSRRG